ncbi:telomerase protein component 1-like [Styela clava]
MVISTENKLLHTNLQSKTLKNAFLVTHSLRKSSNSLPSLGLKKPTSSTRSVLLDKFSSNVKASKLSSSILENNLLRAKENEYDVRVSKEKLESRFSCENKLLTSLSKPSLKQVTQKNAPRKSLVNPLLANSSLVSTRRDLRNSSLRGNLKTGLKTTNTLLAPNFNLEQKRNIVASSFGITGAKNQSGDKVSICEQSNVKPLDENDLLAIVPETDEINFPTIDEFKQTLQEDTSQLVITKTAFIECVCTSLINNPIWFNPVDATRSKLYEFSEAISNSEPEFVLKVALYSRVELNIRATSNFLLAISSFLPPCRPYLKKYFNKAIILPSDWIQVAEFYQSLSDPYGSEGIKTLPSALRKVMVTKFPSFDEYVLAKYNKDKSKSAKKKKKGKKGKNESKEEEKKNQKNTERERKIMDGENEEEDVIKKLKLYSPSFTLKYLIRKLHITKPAQAVMRIIGKKYPESVESFYKCGLEGTWDSALSGKRMKLEVPETWETQVSSKGNLAKTWQDLLDHKKLPFMAMLRNIRNMIKAGISEKHHIQVIKILTNERAVTRSRQFPFRFFSAYEVLSELEKEIEKQEMYKKHGLKYFLKGTQKYYLNRKFGDQQTKTAEEKQVDFIRKQVHKKYGKEFAYNQELINRYRKALDTAVRIATVSNVPPIQGHTVILCDVRYDTMQKRCTSSKGLGSSRTLAEVGLLLGLMCAYSCEACTFLICSGKKYKIIELESGGILENLQRILGLVNVVQFEKHGFIPTKFLDKVLLERMKMDNLLVLSSALETHENVNLNMFMERYRDNINHNLMCYEVDLAGKRASVSNERASDNILRFSGYSDQILKYIALGSGEGQLNFVSNIDKKYELTSNEDKNISIEKLGPVLIDAPLPKPWRTVRVFISSTIKDMLSERDALVHKVFPVLRESAKKLRLNVIETDLRWGITGEDSRYDRSVGICLQEVRKCDIFICMLGERYGWMPKDYGFPDKGSEWLEDYPKGRSITEIEIAQAEFSKKDCYFYLRDSTDIKKFMPKSMKPTFFEQTSNKKSKLRDLKQRIEDKYMDSHVQTYYPTWEGIVDEVPIVRDLNQFEDMILSDMMKGLKKIQRNDAHSKNENSSVFTAEDAIQSQILSQQEFVARSSLLSAFFNKVATLRKTSESPIVALVGRVGSGKSSLLSAVHKKLTTDMQNVISCIHYASVGGLASTPLYRFCCQVVKAYGIEDLNIQNDMDSLIGIFPKLMEKIKNITRKAPLLYLLIDDMDVVGDSIDWLSKLHYEGFTIVVTCVEQGLAHKALKHIPGTVFQLMPDLSMSDKRAIVRSVLGVHSKKLDESHFNNQLQLLLSKHGSKYPLYLSNVCEMIRVQETFESLTKTLKTLPHDLDAILRLQFCAVEARFKSHPILVGMVLGVIHCSKKWGISEEDLFSALSLRFSKETTGEGEVLTKAAFLAVLNSLRGFFVSSEDDRGMLLSIRQSVHQDVVEEKYMVDGEFIKSCHRILTDFYVIKIRENCAEKRNNLYEIVTALTRLPFHLAKSGEQKALKTLLVDFNFIAAKCKLGLGLQLLDDFSLIEAEKAKKYITKRLAVKKMTKPWQEMNKFVSSCIHIIAKYPELIYQYALNQVKDSYPYITVSAMLYQNNQSENQCRIVCLEGGVELASQCIRTYTTGMVNDVRTCVSTHYESDFVAWGSQIGKVGILRKDNGLETNTWIGHSDEVTALCFINKAIFISASADGMVSIWNTVEGYRVRSFKAHNRKVSDVKVRPLRQGSSSRVFATASHDHSIALWNVSNLKFVHRLQTNSSCVNCMDFHPTQARIVAGLWDSSIRIWDVQTLKRVAVIRGHSHAVSSVQYSLCGRYIASCSIFESVIRLWSAGAGVPLGNFGETYLTSPKSLTFSHKGEYIIGAGEGTNESVSQLAVWNSHLGRKEISYMVPDPEDFGNALCCQFNDGKNLLAVGFHEGYIAVYDPLLPNSLFTHKVHESAINCMTWTKPARSNDMFSGIFLLGDAFVPEMIITGGADWTLKALNPAGESVHTTFKGHKAPVLSVDCSTKWVASGGEDFDILLWSNDDLSARPEANDIFGNEMQNVVQANTQSDALIEKKPVIVSYSKALRGHEGPVSCLCFNPEGTMLVSGGRDGKIAYWHIGGLITQTNSSIQMQVQARQGKHEQQQDMKPLVVIDQAHMDWITCCSWNDSSDHIVTGSNDSTLKIWACPQLPFCTGKEHTTPLHILKGHESGIASVVYKFGCIVSAGGEDNTIKIWSHKGIEITNLKTESRTNCCDVTLQIDEKDNEDEQEALNFDDDKPEDPLNWADEVEVAEWNEEHEKRKPGAKRKRKAVAAEMQNFDVVCASNDAQISLWKPLVGNKVVTMSEQDKSVDQVVVNGEDEFISCSSKGNIKAWSVLPSGKDDQIHNGEVTSVIAFQHIVVSSCDAGFVYLWQFDANNELTLAYKAKGHSKRITAMQRLKENAFATVSYDAQIIVWLINCNQDSDGNSQIHVSLQKKTSYKFSDPLISLPASSGIKQKLDFLIGDIKGKIFDCSVEENLEEIETFSMNLDDLHGHKLLACVNDSDLQPTVFRMTDKGRIFDATDIVLSNAEFLHSFALVEGISSKRIFIAGSSNGIIYMPLANITKKLHNDRISVILDSPNTIITGSYDCTIKVWTKPDLKQIGQFFTTSPVTSACCFSDSSIVYGDSSGKIHTLKLHFMTL